jgi:hypothetical protein
MCILRRNNEIVKNVMMFLDISESASHIVKRIYVLHMFVCSQHYIRIMQFFFIELFAQFDSVLILFGIVAAARVVECYMHKHSRPLTFTEKKMADLVVSNYENNRHDVLYRLICYSKSAVHVSGDVFAHH